jgi:hypothetical protein
MYLLLLVRLYVLVFERVSTKHRVTSLSVVRHAGTIDIERDLWWGVQREATAP